MAKQRRSSVSYKDHKRYKRDESEWIVVKNIHEAITHAWLAANSSAYLCEVGKASGFARNCNAMCFACGYLFSKTVLFTAGILSLTQERCKHTPDVTQ